MGARSKIEWLAGNDGRPGASWNPVRGCTRVSEGCRFCYAERQAVRLSAPGQPYEGLVRSTPGGPRWTGRVALVENRLEDPLRWKRPRRIFVNSMSDLFHEGLPDETIDRIFNVMMRASQHEYQILTKRPYRMASYALGRFPGSTFRGARAAPAPPRIPRHLWMGVSIEDQETCERRMPDLARTPATTRWVSFEPLLGPIRLGDFPNGRASSIDWAVIGGESGPGARPMDPSWAVGLLDELDRAGIPVFVKQMGSVWASRNDPDNRKGGDPARWPRELRVRRFPEPKEDEMRRPGESARRALAERGGR